jgi:phosphoribosyl 1,2-cyclic phosphodiesterase
MRCIVLASGSKGNCVYIEGSGDALLIDAGLSRREILSRLGAAGGNPDLISGILVTHEHVDHIRGADTLARHLGVPVYGTGGTLLEFHKKGRTAKGPVRTCSCEYHEKYSVGNFIVEPFETSHDAREPCGFTIREHDLEIACCTDTGVITAPMMDMMNRCDAVILESNHCPDMLRDGPYPEMLKRRIRSKKGHLSNNAAADCLRVLSPHVHEVVLAHLSEVNNTPDRALKTAKGGTGLYVADVRISVATQGPGAENGWPARIDL